jgi:hypothetical protein
MVNDRLLSQRKYQSSRSGFRQIHPAQDRYFPSLIGLANAATAQHLRIPPHDWKPPQRARLCLIAAGNGRSMIRFS